MGYRLARGTSGWLYAVALALVAALVGALVVPGPARVVLLVVVAVLLALFALMVNFFRDPERHLADGVVSPADGVVTEVSDTAGGGSRINIFMNPLDVHVNRAPLPGRVVSVTRKAGGFVPAFKKESEVNERVEWVFETEAGEVRLVQIAGAVARRIIPYLTEGEKVEKGQRIGIIRLGSRVDVYLPPGPRPVVAPGDKVKAGETQLAALA